MLACFNSKHRLEIENYGMSTISLFILTDIFKRMFNFRPVNRNSEYLWINKLTAKVQSKDQRNHITELLLDNFQNLKLYAEVKKPRTYYTSIII